MSALNLAELQQGRKYIISGFREETSPYAEKLFKMGFIEGTPVQLAPVAISDPIVIEVRGSRIALRKNEAEQVQVRELHNA